MNSTTIQLNWTPIPTSCRNGIVRGYKLVCKTIDIEDKPFTIEIRNPNATRKIVGGLEKFTNYSFQVLVYTVKDGNLSKAVFARTHEDGK